MGDPSIETYKCGNCRFYEACGNHGGKCHRYPPSIDAGRTHFHGCIEVSVHDWCGEWLPKEKERTHP